MMHDTGHRRMSGPDVRATRMPGHTDVFCTGL